MGRGKLSGRGRYDCEIQFPERGGNLDHKFWVRNSEKAFGFRELTSKSRGNPQFPDGNPDDSAETLRKSQIAVLGGKLIGRGKYQPEIQFPEGRKINWEGKIN